MSIIDQIKNISKDENIFVNEPMSKHTTFKTGGTADIFVVAKTKDELINLLKLDIPKMVIGNGSNLLVKDGGIRGLVIKVAIEDIEVNDDVIYSGAGVMLAKLSKIAMENSLSGLEFACGIPGTVGGAIFMNAGAYGSEMSNVVLETEFIDKDLNLMKITNHEFDYRKSFFQNHEGVILSTKIKLAKGNKDLIKQKMDENNALRISKQPITKPSAGSTFKRPSNGFAAKLIEDAGLKGYRIGGATVSTLHAGFIINEDNAKSKDILDLIAYVQEEVRLKFNVELEPEIRIIGED